MGVGQGEGGSKLHRLAQRSYSRPSSETATALPAYRQLLPGQELPLQVAADSGDPLFSIGLLHGQLHLHQPHLLLDRLTRPPLCKPGLLGLHTAVKQLRD